MTEVGLFDDEKDLVVISKFQSPVLRQGTQQISVKIDF
jgi:RNA:NAD 2'-phosphotransferase (TPT1/KptA family)